MDRPHFAKEFRAGVEPYAICKKTVGIDENDAYNEKTYNHRPGSERQGFRE